MSNHTPAPWVINTYGDITYFGDEEGGVCECVAFGRGGEGIRIKNDVDRDLILAAPDMYKLLDSINEIFNDTPADSAKVSVKIDLMRYEIGKVLAKARGDV